MNQGINGPVEQLEEDVARVEAKVDMLIHRVSRLYNRMNRLLPSVKGFLCNKKYALERFPCELELDHTGPCQGMFYSEGR